MTVRECKLIQLPKIADPRGNLSVIEGGRQIPFDIKRVFYLYDVPGGETRAGHANKNLQQLLIAMSGSFDVVIDDGMERKTFTLNRSYFGLYIPGMLWRELENFSSGAVCVVLCSDFYDAADYYRDYDEYVQVMKGLRG
ncbi:MAG TPA: FdtA/QdtA family cupin domain-containing protein [Armatimonadota bacterium]|nr:FdtA/QdtA family cupin domain-containing protein [Armatimonadota bacterium]